MSNETPTDALTENARAFLTANAKCAVMSGSVHGRNGGATYTLTNGKSFSLSVEECRSIPTPRWALQKDTPL